MATTYELIASNTVGSGGAASVTFSSIPNTYTDLQVFCSTRDNESANWNNFNISINGTAYSSNWTLKGLYGTGSAAGSEQPASSVGQFSTTSSQTANTFSNVQLYFPNYNSSNYKSVSSDTVTENNATAALAYMGAQLWSNTAAISSLTFTPASGKSFVQYTSIYIYGIKNS